MLSIVLNACLNMPTDVSSMAARTELNRHSARGCEDVTSRLRAGVNRRKPGASWKTRSKPRSSLGILRAIVPRKYRNSLPGKVLRTYGKIVPRITRCTWTTGCYGKVNVAITLSMATDLRCPR